MTQANEAVFEVPQSLAATIGTRLREARQSQDLSLAELAKSMRLGEMLLDLIESGQWDQLGPSVYGRGYVRAYAQRLSVDTGDAVAYFDAVDATHEPLEQRIVSAAQSMRLRVAASARWVAYVAATALIAAPAAVWVMHAFHGNPQVVVTPVESTDQNAVQESESPLLASLTPSLRASNLPTTEMVRDTVAADRNGEVLATMPVSSEARAEIDDEGRVDTTALATEPGHLVLVFAEQAWLDVADGSGKRLAYGLIPAASEKRFELSAGLVVRVGNADAVTASLLGKPFDLSPYINNDLAKFTLPDAR